MEVTYNKLAVIRNGKVRVCLHYKILSIYHLLLAHMFSGKYMFVVDAYELCCERTMGVISHHLHDVGTHLSCQNKKKRAFSSSWLELLRRWSIQCTPSIAYIVTCKMCYCSKTSPTASHIRNCTPQPTTCLDHINMPATGELYNPWDPNCAIYGRLCVNWAKDGGSDPIDQLHGIYYSEIIALLGLALLASLYIYCRIDEP